MLPSRHLTRLIATLFLTTLFAGHAPAMELRKVPLGPIVPAPSKITLDGNLDEWRSISGLFYKPLEQMVSSAGDPTVVAYLNDPASAEFKTCYDADALYIAINWHDRQPGTNQTASGDADHWSNGGEGFELHLLTDRVLHLAVWPLADGKSVAVMARYGNDTAWKDLSSAVTTADKVSPESSNYGLEVKIPWSAITTDGKPSANGKVELAVDFAFNAISPSFVDKLREARWSASEWAQGLSADFLTARPNLVSAGYIGNPLDWAEWNLGGTAADNQVATAPDGSTSLASFSVPAASSPPSLDGSLTGWDPASFTTASFLGAFYPDRLTSRIAAQSDADNLYLTVHYATPGPVNWKAESTQEGFNGGDALQIRISDGAQKINLCGWFDAKAGKAALTADGHDLPSPFILQQGAQEQFHPDGRGGYIQQIALPWKLLFGHTPTAQDKIRGTLQFWYADISPLFSFYAGTTLKRQAALAVSYHLPADGQLTLGLYGKDGRLLRWLAQDDFRHAGDNKEPWDGLDQWGNEVPAGSYVLKGLYHAPITTDYKVSVGNPGTPPWPTPDGKGDWIGDESDPQGVATDGKWVYLASPGAEKGFWLIGVDETGQRQWGIAGSPDQPRAVALSVNGDYLYALYSGPTSLTNSRIFSGDPSQAIERVVLMCYDKHTGKPARFTITTPRTRVATAPYRQDIHWLDDLRNNKGFTPEVYGGQPRYAGGDVGETTDALGMAAVGDKVYVSLLYDNKVIVVDAATGKTTSDEIPLDQPAGLYALDANTLLAISGKQLVKIDLGIKAVTPLVTSGLSAPFAVTTDKSGTIYVSDWGSSFQVKAYDASGKLLRAIGKEGGRPWVGKWDPNGMLVPRQMAVTDEGKLWVAEDDGAPPRVSVWDSQTGNLIRDYIGPTAYGGGTYFAIDPKDPTIVHALNTTFKVDYDKKTYTPLSVDFRRQNRDDPFAPFGHGGAWGETQIRYHNGHEYFVTSVTGGQLSFLQKQGDVYRSVAAIGSRGAKPGPIPPRDGTAIDQFDSDLGGHHVYNGYFPDFFKDHYSENYTWTDTNGDNLVQPEEMKWHAAANVPYQPGTQASFGGFWGGFAVGSDWTIYTFGQFRDKVGIFKIPLKGWTPAGAPIYDIADATAIGFDFKGASEQSIYATRDDKLILCGGYEIGTNPDTFTCFDTQGHRLWSISRPPKPWVEPSRMQARYPHAQAAVYDFDIPKIGDVFGTWAWHGAARPYLIATDGLYVGTMLEDTLLGPKALWGESYTYYYQAPDGTPYVVNGANQAEHILQIKGLDAETSGRFTGTYALSDSDVKLADSMREVPEAVTAPKPVIAMTWLSKPPTIDGDLSDWNMSSGVTLDGGNGRTADVALGRDADNLYLAYKVAEKNPMRNGGTDWQTLFTTGDCVDLMLQTDPKADPNRRSAVAGDERLLFTMFQDKPLAVLYRPVAPGSSSPVRLSTASFDEITKLDSAHVEIKRGQGFYTVEVSVPLADVGLDAKEKDDLRGDVGVIFADDSGQSRSQRLYYYNQQTQMVNDLPTEATLQPANWGKIAMPLGPNLIQNGGFEDPFVDSKDDADKGWYVAEERNGADAQISDESPYSGHHSLLLESSVGVKYPPEAYNNPDSRAFNAAANGGKGGAWVQVSQHVPIVGGHLYSFRVEYRSQDYPAGSTRPGHPRGAAGFGIGLAWDCPPGPDRGKRMAIADSYTVASVWAPTPDWFTLYNTNRSTIAPSAPYTAPATATGADLVISMRNSLDALPKLYFDDVELVDVTTDQMR